MGLDALVFRNVCNVPASVRAEGVVVDSGTGEVSFTRGRPDPSGSVFVAESKRLGNVAQVGFLREAIRKGLGSGRSVLIEKVLYSATHCGDQIGANEFVQLRSEITKLREENDSTVATFIRDMEALLAAAEREHNPIVFA